MLNDGLILSEEDKYLLRNFRIIFDKSNGYFTILELLPLGGHKS